MKRPMILLVFVLIAVSAVLLVLAVIESYALNSVRAYVAGENLWAKAQRDAVRNLYRYAHNGDIQHYKNFHQHLKITLADKKARLAMLSDPVDYQAATEGLLGGGNHPDDVPGMISFFLRFQSVSYMEQAIDAWTQADAEIENLIALATQINLAVENQDHQEVALLLIELDALNVELNRLENEFSAVLGEGARWIKGVTFSSILGAFAALVVLSLIFATSIIKRIVRTEQALRFSETRFNTLTNAELVGIFDFDLDGTIYSANDSFYTLLGYTREEFLENGSSWRKITPEDQFVKDLKAFEQILERGVCEPYEKEYYHKDGKRVSVYIGGALYDKGNQQGIAFVVDISAKKELENNLKLAATVLDNSHDGIVILDRNRNVKMVNRAYLELIEESAANIIGSPVQLYAENGNEELIELNFATKKHWEIQSCLITTKNTIAHVNIDVTAIHDENDKLVHYVVTYHDNTEQFKREEQLRNLANSDHLTGLANRVSMTQHLQGIIEQSENDQRSCAVLFIDLNKFKSINDQYGHDVGDAVLIEVAERLKHSVRNDDIVSRLGGDEFVVVLQQIESEETAILIAEKINNALASTFTHKGLQLPLDASIGISLYPKDGETIGDLLRSADTAMYLAKANAKNNIELFSD